MVEREPEYNDDDRLSLLGFRRYEAEVGPCGYHHSLTSNLDNAFQATSSFCTVCAEMDRHNRVLRSEDEKARKPLRNRDGDISPSVKDPADGRSTYMKLLSPEEVAKAKRRVKEVDRDN